MNSILLENIDEMNTDNIKVKKKTFNQYFNHWKT